MKPKLFYKSVFLTKDFCRVSEHHHAFPTNSTKVIEIAHEQTAAINLRQAVRSFLVADFFSSLYFQHYF